jgi:hypothetical protein
LSFFEGSDRGDVILLIIVIIILNRFLNLVN